jgi:hypothetical protein
MLSFFPLVGSTPADGSRPALTQSVSKVVFGARTGVERNFVIPSFSTAKAQALAKCCNVLLMLGLVVAGRSSDPAATSATSWLVCAAAVLGNGVGLFMLWRLVQKTSLVLAVPLRLLGTGIVLLQAVEQFKMQKGWLVLAGGIAMLGAVKLLLHLHRAVQN